ncbi:ligase-associated DNA damage response endonuclease PdeM [Neorhodopirellula pilleata]|uniref:Calcineurin-like phosphoesterase domain-containing protein n=1 Tax=Neorhodopirellula pilleata TaxID=2714738 RepID=A0A5C6AP03_9BACT|nr:ligase-associated DNA damage response endonuclease PdeM [Neorhodopirellula pilleata]TWU01715.1 hypothetical protein Pla100_14500 [Neorhodopirellula pilleata]
MSQSIDVQLAGQSFQLLADRGLYWADEQTLFVADTHFGKEATFRRHGVPVPMGSTDATLDAIRRMIHETKASSLIILGDMFHARSSLSPDVVESLTTFFEALPAMTFTLIRGNHDALLGQLPAAWPLEVVEPVMRMNRVALGHHPIPLPDKADLYLCGHLHPALKLGSQRHAIGKLPCFWLSGRCLVLPAIGNFTGTHAVKLNPSDQAWVVADNEIYFHNPNA